MFIITVIEFLHENQWLNEQMIKECQIWFSMLIKLINFKNNHCLKCVDMVASFAKKPTFGSFYIKEVC